MAYRTANGHILPLEVEWEGIKSCQDFLAIEGMTLEQAAHLSMCNCELHRRLRSEEEWENPNKSTGYQPG